MPDGINIFEIFKNGSTWLRADFHLHTRADKHFVYKGDDNTFLTDYVVKLKEQSINIGVITNHNKFNKDEFISLRKKARKEEIFILPGVELSVNDGANGIHTLIVFSDAWLENGQDYINQFLNVAFEGKTPSQYEQEDGRCSLSLIETIKKLDFYQKEYFLIFAHVEQSSGLWNELDGGRLSELAQNKLFEKRTLGFQKVRTHDKKDRINRLKIQSWFKNWYPAEVEGSDCKTIEEIGSKEGQSWLKLGDCTYEAVKYALVDYKNRVSISKPDSPKHSFIKSISFEAGILKDQIVHLSPELNTFIGIRGSGKSSILEAIRYVLDYPFGEKATDRKYKTDLVTHTLGSGGKAVITAIDQYGSEYQIKRILNNSPEVFVNNKLQPGVSIRETIIKNPIYFGQKDLSASGEGFEKDLVEKLVGESLYNIRFNIESQKQIVSDLVFRFQKITKVDEQIADYTQKKQDAEFNINKFKEYNIEEKFKKQTDFDTDERKIKQILNDVDSLNNDLDSFISKHEDNIKNHQLYSSSQNQIFFSLFLKEYVKIVSILENHKSDSIRISEINKTLKQNYYGFLETKKTFADEFAETRRRIAEDLKVKGAISLNLEEYPSLKGKVDLAEKMLEALHKQKSQSSILKNDLLQALSDLNNLWHEEFLHIKAQLDKINNKQSSLTIEVDFKGDKIAFLSFMKSMFKGSGIRDSSYISLVNEYSDFGSVFNDFENAKLKVGNLTETFEKYFFDNLKELLTYQVQNKFTIKYRGKELQHHSLGQRASALILFVLNQQENDLIIVDQPEDDLDNQTIYEDVIKLIRKLKPNTQFIFATHNANFPVLGDAEQIHSCRYQDEKMTILSGSIDSPLLQKEIVDIMEGGEDAFNKRKEIYGIWKPQNL